MASDKFRLYTTLFKYLIPFGFKRIYQILQASYHRWTYQCLPSPDHVVIIGGSFAGLSLAKRLSETLPAGYKVILIEKNSHFNFSWVFPRFAVIPGYEEQAFIPYDGIVRDAPAGIWSHVHDCVVQITPTQIYLASGEKIDYAFLAIATGSSQPVPARTIATESQEASAELRKFQQAVQDAKRIAVVGGGAVGIEIASDIKSFFPQKDVTLFHSRKQLLSAFGLRLHEYVLETFKDLSIHVVCGERPEILPGQSSLRTSTGVQIFDLIIPCTGQRPNSMILKDLAPESISKETNRILVKPTLQIRDESNALPHIFALGDVAESGGPKMTLAGQAQAEVVMANILSIIKRRSPSAIYTPHLLIEGAIRLTLGKKKYVVYAQESGDSDLIVPYDDGKEDLGVGRAWKWMGAEYQKIQSTPPGEEAIGAI